jgi:hypothetical protein
VGAVVARLITAPLVREEVAEGGAAPLAVDETGVQVPELPPAG